LREKGIAGEKAAQQFRQTFEDQLDSMVEEYNRQVLDLFLQITVNFSLLVRTGIQTHSSNESDADHFEQVNLKSLLILHSCFLDQCISRYVLSQRV
jgi:hypothetical protein